MKGYEITIIVPVYNEFDNLDRIKTTFLDYLSKNEVKTKVLFIDDGSSDSSFIKILDICNSYKQFEYIKFNKNYGLSAAIKAGIDYCSTELLGYIDADLQTSPYDFDILLQYIDNADAVVGYRGKRKDTFSKKIQSLLANSFRRVLIKDGIIDTGCPLKVFKTETAKKIPFFDGMHRFLPALIQLQGGTVKQVRVRHFERIAGKSKFNLLNRSIKPLQDVFAYRWMHSRYIHYSIDKSSIRI